MGTEKIMIDYRIISEAIEFYGERGYTEVDVPWVVKEEPYYATKPPGVNDIVANTVPGREHAYDVFAKSFPPSPIRGFLPASGEQAFIQMLLDGQSKWFGKAFCITPCFRYEYEYNYLQKPWFLKLELITTEDTYSGLMADAADFFSGYLDTEVVSTFVGNDLVSAKTKIELGSYGKRKYKDLVWYYGTGVAEPRLSMAINEERKCL